MFPLFRCSLFRSPLYIESWVQYYFSEEQNDSKARICLAKLFMINQPSPFPGICWLKNMTLVLFRFAWINILSDLSVRPRTSRCPSGSAFSSRTSSTWDATSGTSGAWARVQRAPGPFNKWGRMRPGKVASTCRKNRAPLISSPRTLLCVSSYFLNKCSPCNLGCQFPRVSCFRSLDRSLIARETEGDCVTKVCI